MAVLTKDNVMQARYTNPEQDTISILFVDHDAEGKARANYEIFCQAGDQQHKELHAAGWDHATIEKETVEWIKDSHRQAGEALLGHNATKIIDERLQATKDALANEMEAIVHAKKTWDDMHKEIEGLMQQKEILINQKKDLIKQKEVAREKITELLNESKKIAHLRKTEGTSVLIANFLFDNNTDEAAIEILEKKTGNTGNSLIEILTKCTKEGGGNTKY